VEQGGGDRFIVDNYAARRSAYFDGGGIFVEGSLKHRDREWSLEPLVRFGQDEGARTATLSHQPLRYSKMSITFELRGRAGASWTLSSNCLDQIARLRNTVAKSNIDLVFGDERTKAGTQRNVDRALLLLATRELLPAARKLAVGFEVRVPPLFAGAGAIVGRGVGGALIDGRHHYISCVEDYWTIQRTEHISEGPEPPRHYEPAEIQTQNMGVVKVMFKNGCRSDLAAILWEAKRFLEDDNSDHVAVIWG
jgi:hypothetical protein